jgi:hypothetical protein
MLQSNLDSSKWMNVFQPKNAFWKFFLEGHEKVLGVMKLSGFYIIETTIFGCALDNFFF